MLPQSIQKYKLHAKKSLGQNFLVDEGSLENIAGAIEVDGKNIVEVGPGYGALTEKLIAQTPKSLTLVELDSDMIAVLEQRIQEGELQTEGVNIHIEHIDILKYEPIFQVSQPSLQLSPLEDNGDRSACTTIFEVREKQREQAQSYSSSTPKERGQGGEGIQGQGYSGINGESEYSVIANIPYYITSPILRHFLYEVSIPPQEMVIMMQEDVGRKILIGQSFSPPTLSARFPPQLRGIKGEYKKIRSSVLSLFIAKKCFVREVCIVPKEHFYPAPKVESIVLHFTSYDHYRDIDDGVFLEIIKQGFREPRKKLFKNLGNSGYDKGKVMEIFEKLGLSDTVRGEELGIEEWIEVVKELEIDERRKRKD